VVIAGAGGAAHLPGHGRVDDPAAGDRRTRAAPAPRRDGLACCPSCRCRPGCRSRRCPSAGARNAGLLAVRILAVSDPDLLDAMRAFQGRLADAARAKDVALQDLLR
jgi:5-(carboxyamino)imidazole ribonucleotide mutase